MMTYTERRHTMDDAKSKPTTIGKAVKQVLSQAFEQGRAVCGVFECVDILDRDAEDAMFCVLPEGKSDDVSVRIQHTLIEAFCRENDVKVLKVDSATKISTIFSSAVSKETKEKTYSTDFSCVIVQKGAVCSRDDQFVSDYCENFMLGGIIPHGKIEIPV